MRSSVVTEEARAMRPPIEVAIELTTEELLSSGAVHCVEIDDIDTLTAPQTETSAASTDTLPLTDAAELATDDAFEIELDAAEMDDLLGDPNQRRES
jgi:hypothetical protein